MLKIGERVRARIFCKRGGAGSGFILPRPFKKFVYILLYISVYIYIYIRGVIMVALYGYVYGIFISKHWDVGLGLCF